MYQSDEITNAFLDIDRAESVFQLFFVFVSDEGTAVQEEQTFECAIYDIVGGANVPHEALERLRVIYERTAKARPALYDSALRLKEQLSDERLLLVMIFSVLLRLAMEEGMMSRRDREQLTQVFQVFMFTPEELYLVPDELQDNLEAFIYANGLHKGTPPKQSLSEHFKTLECGPESSFEEVRSSYRRLVKKYHPDRQSRSSASIVAYRKQFEKVQAAYESITRTKKLA